ncbi:hypothetical protein [Phascolarctobacterium succinatutens]|uniref:hypothetical protein n=1 Tax=Phascolarctobacterium succinatutens TaxID=626940 RepID=UPI0026F132B4|nr:hypothetical protein [Phascolarctobacterium succinatutens]
MLEVNQLLELEERVRKALNEKLEQILTTLNRTGKLEEALELLGLSDLLQAQYAYKPYRTGKIYIVGQSDIKKNQLLGVIKELGFDKKRFEFCLEYEDVKRFNFAKLFYNPENSLVLVGPMPHKTAGSGDYSSAITAIEQTEGSPNVLRCGSNTLKITKQSIREALQKALASGIVVA